MADEELRRTFAKNLNYYLGLNGYNQADLARHLHVSTATTAKWCTAQTMPRIDKIQSICNWLGTEKADLLEEPSGVNKKMRPKSALEEETIRVAGSILRNPDIKKLLELESKLNTQQSSAVRIPVLGRVAAGIPLEMVEDVIDWEEIDDATAKQGTIFALSIKGDSMEPRIVNGDVVIVRQQDDAESGEIVIVSVNGDDATCKRLRKYKDGIELVPSNPAYPPLYFSNEDIITKPVKILGKVIELRGKF